MVFASTGPLTIKEENLETKAKNLLKKAIHVQNGESKTFCAEGNIHEEIEFLINNEYILKKESPSPEYEITSKGRGYILGQFPRF